MRIAVVHGWLNGMRGAKKCLGVASELFPDSDISMLSRNRGTVSPTMFAERRVGARVDDFEFLFLRLCAASFRRDSFGRELRGFTHEPGALAC